MAKRERGWDLVAVAVAERIRKLRIEQEISQETLARRANVSNQTVYRMEGGHWAPASLEKVSRALGVPVFQLLEGLDFGPAPRRGAKRVVRSARRNRAMGGSHSPHRHLRVLSATG